MIEYFTLTPLPTIQSLVDFFSVCAGDFALSRMQAVLFRASTGGVHLYVVSEESEHSRSWTFALFL